MAAILKFKKKSQFLDPNAPNNRVETPIYCAAYIGHTEIVKILAPLTKIPMLQITSMATLFGHTEIVQILAALTDNPDAPDKVFGLSVEAAKFWTISVFPNSDAQYIGVIPLMLSAALGFFSKGAKILTISVCPIYAAQQIGVSKKSSNH